MVLTRVLALKLVLAQMVLTRVLALKLVLAPELTPFVTSPIDDSKVINAALTQTQELEGIKNNFYLLHLC
jgi:hypothetical protein